MAHLYLFTSVFLNTNLTVSAGGRNRQMFHPHARFPNVYADVSEFQRFSIGAGYGRTPPASPFPLIPRSVDGMEKGQYFTPTAQRWTEARVMPGSIYNSWMDEAELVSRTVYILAFIVGSHVLFLVVTPRSSYWQRHE